MEKGWRVKSKTCYKKRGQKKKACPAGGGDTLLSGVAGRMGGWGCRRGRGDGWGRGLGRKVNRAEVPGWRETHISRLEG